MIYPLLLLFKLDILAPQNAQPDLTPNFFNMIANGQKPVNAA